MTTLSQDQTRRLRLRAQHLDHRDGRLADAADLVRAIGGVQAQDLPAAALSIRARTRGLTAEDVERARVEERSVLHTWAMRGTLHLVATEDAGWLLSLLNPIFMAADRGRRAQLGLDEATVERGVTALRKLLAEGPQTRAELAEPLAAQDIPVEGQALVHLIAYAVMAGVVCHGPDRGGKPCYVLLDDWVKLGAALDPDAATTELARRYLVAYGPATPEDLAAWSGLKLGAARAAMRRIGDELIEVQVGERAAWLPKAHAAWLKQRLPDAGVRLLPAYDTALLGYAKRDLMVDPAHARRVHPGGGTLRPVVLVDGRACATWRVTRKRDRLAVVIEPFDDFAPEVLRAVEDEARDVGRFLGQRAVVE